MPLERLDKLLSSTGRWSRREVKQLVKEGRVLADGRIARACDEKHDPETVSLQVDGQSVRLRARTVLMLNKPAGVVSATEDPRQKTVLDLLPAHLRRLGLFPVGRLDRDTEGLLLLTDDGALAHALLSPKKHVDKVYLARVEGRLTGEDAAAFAGGLTLSDGTVCAPAQLEILSSGGECLVRVTLREGKYHQVKRMVAARGAKVLSLKRVAMGPLRLDGSLAPGEWRELTPEEERKLPK